MIKQQIDTTTPQGRLVFHLMAALDEFQRELIVEGTVEGLAAASPRPDRRPEAELTASQLEHARQLYAGGQHSVAIGKLLGVSRQTIYRALEPEAVSGSATV